MSTLRKKVNPKCGYEEVIKELSSYKHNKNISKLKKLMIKVTNLSRMKKQINLKRNKIRFLNPNE